MVKPYDKYNTKYFTGIKLTVYPQYVGIKKPLDGFSHYINIGVRMRELFWLKRYLADVLSP